MTAVAQPGAANNKTLQQILKEFKLEHLQQPLKDLEIEDLELLNECSAKDIEDISSNQKIHFLNGDERKIMDKLYERHSDISEDIQTVQTAENEFNESVVAAKKVINESVNYILDEVSKKKMELLKQVDDIHNENKKAFGTNMSNLEKVSKLSLKNKEKFNVVATSKDLSPSQKTEALKRLLAIELNENDDDQKNDDRNYDHFKIIGYECTVSGKMNAKFNKQSLATFLQSFMEIECAKNTSKWKTKRNYSEKAIDWDDVIQLDLRNGTGGKSGENTYTVNNVCVVQASHPVYVNNNYYYMPYMFNWDVKAGHNLRSHWLSQGPNEQNMVFTFNTAVKLSYINAYENVGNDGYGRCKYGIDLFYDGKWNVLCDLIDTSKDVDGVPRKHIVKKEVEKVRFNFSLVSSYISMKEIDFFVAKETQQ